MLQIGQNIKLIRGLAEKTQEEFALLIGEKLSNLKTYETKQVMPKIHIQHIISKIGGVTLDDLLNKKLTPDDITINLKVEKVKKGSVASNKPQQGAEHQKQGLDLIKEVNQLRDDQLRIMATLKVLVSEIGPLIAKENHQSKASASLQLEKDISEMIESLKTWRDKKLSGD